MGWYNLKYMSCHPSQMMKKNRYSNYILELSEKLTGSSNLKSREKNRMKSTAEDLVIVYLQENTQWWDGFKNTTHVPVMWSNPKPAATRDLRDFKSTIVLVVPAHMLYSVIIYCSLLLLLPVCLSKRHLNSESTPNEADAMLMLCLLNANTIYVSTSEAIKAPSFSNSIRFRPFFLVRHFGILMLWMHQSCFILFFLNVRQHNIAWYPAEEMDCPL